MERKVSARNVRISYEKAENNLSFRENKRESFTAKSLLTGDGADLVRWAEQILDVSVCHALMCEDMQKVGRRPSEKQKEATAGLMAWQRMRVCIVCAHDHAHVRCVNPVGYMRALSSTPLHFNEWK